MLSKCVKKGVLALALAMFFAVPALASGANVAIDGQLISFPDQKPYIDQAGRVLVPVRFVTEKLGAEVEADFSNPLIQKVYISKGETNITLTIGQKVVEVNGEKKEMDTAAVISGGRTMVPFRFVSNYMGNEVEWQSSSRVAHVFTKGQEMQERGKVMGDIEEELRLSQSELNPSEYAITKEVGKYYGRGNEEATIYRKDNLPITTNDSTIVKIERVKYSYHDVLRVTQTKPTDGLNIYFDKEKIKSAVANNRTNKTYFEKDKTGNYYCDVYLEGLKSLGEPNIVLEDYKEIGFEHNWKEIFYIKNPYYKD